MGTRRSRNTEETYDNVIYLNPSRAVVSPSAPATVLKAVATLMSAIEDGHIKLLPIFGKGAGIGLNSTAGHENHVAAYKEKAGETALLFCAVRLNDGSAKAEPTGVSI